MQEKRGVTTPDDDRGNHELTRWKTQSVRWRGQLGVTEDYAPYTKSLDLSKTAIPISSLGRPSKRVLDLIDCTAMEVSKRLKRTIPDSRPQLKGMLLDVSQSHHRKVFSSTDGTARTLTTASRLFSFNDNRMLAPVEHMFLQGFSQDLVVPDQISDHALRCMAGEGMALPCLATVLLAILLTKDIC